MATEPVLRAAVIWGATVIAQRDLRVGQALCPSQLIAIPDAVGWPEVLVQAHGRSWQIPAGVTAPRHLVRAGEVAHATAGRRPVEALTSPVPLAAGDHGIFQQGLLSVFFQVSAPCAPLREARLPDASWTASLLFSSVAVLGGLALTWAVTTPRVIPKPIELVPYEQLVLRVKADPNPPPAPAALPQQNRLEIDEPEDPETPSVDDEPAPTASPEPEPEPASDERPSEAAPSAPEKSVPETTQAGGGQPLSPQQIARTMSSRYGAFRACYEQALAVSPALQGAVTVSFRVSATGQVSSAQISSSSLSNDRVHTCMVRQLQRLAFPAAEQGVNASYTFVFKPKR